MIVAGVSDSCGESGRSPARDSAFQAGKGWCKRQLLLRPAGALWSSGTHAGGAAFEVSGHRMAASGKGDCGFHAGMILKSSSRDENFVANFSS